MALFLSNAQALPIDRSLGEYRHTAWLARDGAPAYTFGWPELAQAADGYINLATSTGLVRFNGLDFTTIDMPLPASIGSQSLSTLYVSPSGGLWLGFTFGGVGHFENGRWTFFTAHDGIPEATPGSFVQDPNGDIWMTTKSQVWTLHSGTWKRSNVLKDSDVLGGLFFDSEGGLWLDTTDAVYHRPPGAQNAVRVQQMASHYGGGIVESADGAIWLDDLNTVRLIAHVKNPARITLSNYRSVIFDRQGVMWGCDEAHGPWRFASAHTAIDGEVIDKATAVEHLIQGRGTPSVACAAPLEDGEGNIWIYTTQGLERLSDAPLEHLYGYTAGALTTANLQSPMLLADGPRLWSSIFTANDDGFVLARFQDGHITTADAGLRVHPSGIVLKNGDLLVSAVDGLRQIPQQGKPQTIPYPVPTTYGLSTQSLVEDGEGHIWISIPRAPVFERRGMEWRSYGDQPALPRSTPIYLATDVQQTLWLTYTGSRLSHVEGTVTNYTIEPSIGNVLSFYGKRSRIWAGGAKGLAVLDKGRFRVLHSEHPQDLMSISGMIETMSGDLWVNGATGFVHITADQLERSLKDPDFRIATRVFGPSDGVAGIEERLRPLPTMAEAADGKLWFATSSDIYRLDPLRPVDRGLRPPVHITGLTVDRKAQALGGQLTLPPLSNELRFDFIGLSFAHPEKVQYRYRLQGFDRGWHDGGTARQAVYGNVGPGHYVFQVTAANEQGNWNDVGDRLEFTLLPALYQTLWLKIVATLTIVGSLCLLYLARVRQLSGRLKERHAERLAERDRIARDLHDTLLQSTEGLILKVQSAVLKMPESDSARTALMQSLDRASELALEGRESIQGLRERTQRRELGEALELSIRTASIGQTRIDVAIEGMPVGLRSEVWEDLYRIGHEALLNALKHAHAQHIWVRVRYQLLELVLEIEDDGKGLERGRIDISASPGHFGLAGMRERSKQLGARLEIWSVADAGTRITVRLAGRKAYRHSSARLQNSEYASDFRSR